MKIEIIMLQLVNIICHAEAASKFRIPVDSLSKYQRTLDVAVKSNKSHIMENLLRSNRRYYKVSAEKTKKTFFTGEDFQIISFRDYNRFKNIIAYLRYLARKYSNIVSLKIIGVSTEGRPIMAIVISRGSFNKPVILIDCGIHARERASPALCLYMLNQIVENPLNAYMMNHVRWVIIPVLNPDGYEYSMTKIKKWRKNRSKGSKCFGVDLNRNFGYHWLESGASTNECEFEFAGKKPFSAPEARALRDFALEYSKIIKLYLSFHSYGSYILYPYGYAKKYPKNVKELHDLGQRVSKAIYGVHGTRYTVGSSATALYEAAGGSDDWMMGVAKIPLSYTIELDGRDQGFFPDKTNIFEIIDEMFQGVKVFHDYVKQKYS